MTSDAEAIREFQRVLELPEHERNGAIEAIRETNPQLAGRVSSLLATDASLADLAGIETKASVLEGVTGLYRLIRPIGRGSTATVWLGVSSNASAEQIVAVKVFDRPLDDGCTARTIHTDLSAYRLRGTVPILDHGVDGAARPFVVLEYVRGSHLTEHCDLRLLSIHERLEIFARLCDAVAELHATSFLHGDLKPSNVLVTPSGEIRILDVSVGRMEPDTGRAPALTRAYAAPERLDGDQASVRTDVYSLGIMLCEIVTGRRPQAPGGSIDWDALLGLDAQPPGSAAWSDTAVMPPPTTTRRTSVRFSTLI